MNLIGNEDINLWKNAPSLRKKQSAEKIFTNRLRIYTGNNVEALK